MLNKYRFNTIDAYGTFGIVFNKGTYNELLKKAKRKEGYSKNWPDEDGTDRDDTQFYYESRNLSLTVTLTASSEADFYSKYSLFTNFLYTAGYFFLDVVDMNRRFKLLYVDMPSVETLTIFRNNNDIGCEFTIQFVDDFPTTNLTIPA